MRLMGQETEYAVRTGDCNTDVDHTLVYDALMRALAEITLTQKGRTLFRMQTFTENGGAFHYEFLPTAPSKGLIEGATPECRGALELIRYQRAQERLLLKAMETAETILAGDGHPVKLGLLKNCRDAEGHVYGVQENYEATLAQGPRLFFWRLGLILLVIPWIASILLYWLCVLLNLILILAGCALALLLWPILGLLGGFWITSLRPHFQRSGARNLGQTISRLIGYWEIALTTLLLQPLFTLFHLLFRLCAFRNIRNHACTFLISRAIFTGTGRLMPDGSFEISEKATAAQRTLRITPLPFEHAIFDIGNFLKQLVGCDFSFTAGYLKLFRGKHRLQLGISDANHCQVADFFKYGATALIFEMAEQNQLTTLPRLRHPIRAARRLASDPEATLLTDQGPFTALQLQKLYYDHAITYLHGHTCTELEHHKIAALWKRLITDYEQNPAKLFGHIDWITKKALIEDRRGHDENPDALKKIDLKYSELGKGYFAQLDLAGFTHKILGDQDIEKACIQPPADSPALARSRTIRRYAGSGERITVHWEGAKIGGGLAGKIVPFKRR